MLQAVVDAALRAVLVSIVLSALLALAVFALTRLQFLAASTRHALWMAALVATGVMPLAGLGASFARALAPAPRGAERITTERSIVERPSRDEFAVLAVRRDDGSVVRTVTSRSRRTTLAAVQPALEPRPAFGTPLRLTAPLAAVIADVWIFGALIGLGGLVTSLVRVRGLKRRSRPLEGTLADELPWLTDERRGREIYLRLSYETETPVAVGFARPVILIPGELATSVGLGAIESLVLHEHAHLRRYDDWTNLLQRTIERIFWFNPVVWLMGRRIALEREIASDDAVVARTGEAHTYASSLWRLAREMRMPEHAVVAPGALFTRKQISIRIEQLLDAKRNRLHRSPAAAGVITAAGLTAVAFVASSAPAVELPAPPAPAVSAVHAIPPAAPHLAAAPRVIDRIVIVKVLASPHPRALPKSAPPALAPHRAASGIAPLVHLVPSRGVSAAVAAPSLRAPAGEALDHPLAPLPAAPPVPPAAAAAAAESAASARAFAPAAERLAQVARRFDVDVHGIVRNALNEAGLQQLTVIRAVAPRGHTAASACDGCSMRGADLRGIDLRGRSLVGEDFSGADLRGANLAGVKLQAVSFARADLRAADLRGASFVDVDLSDANLDGALLDDVTLTGVALRHVVVHGAALRAVIAGCSGCSFAGLPLRGADLRGLTLSGLDLRGADLRGTNFSNAHLDRVDLAQADLRGADLTGTTFTHCNLTGVTLRGAATTGMSLQQGTTLDS